jgi:hypothetical protein
MSDVPVVAKTASEPRYRIPSYVAAAVGAVGLGLGTAFDVQSGNQANTLKNVTLNANGVVTNLTQRQAFALDQSRRTNAAVGNTLLGVGAGLVVLGAVLFVLGSLSASPESPAAGAPQ